MKSCEGGSAEAPEKRLTARSNEPHQALTGRAAAAVGRAEGRQHERRTSGDREVRRDLRRVVRVVLLVLVERHAPGHLLRRRVDRHRPHELAQRAEQVACHRADRPVGRERHAARTPVAVLGDRFVRMQVERHDERAGAVGRRQHAGLPAPRGQPQRGVLQLRLGRRERDRELAEHLGMRVQRVARRAPVLVALVGPRCAWHAGPLTCRSCGASPHGCVPRVPAPSPSRRAPRRAPAPACGG